MFNTKVRLQDKIPTVDLDMSDGEIVDNEDNSTQPNCSQTARAHTLPLPAAQLEKLNRHTHPSQGSKHKEKKDTFTFKGSFNPGQVTEKRHPRPANKKAKHHLKRLHQLGYSSFEETGIRYWEPYLPGEDWSVHNARRQAECDEMDCWLKKAAPKVSEEIQNNTQPGINLQPMVILPEIPSRASPSMLAPNGKRPASPTSMSEDKTKHHKSVPQVERLKEDLEHERKMRKQLAAQVSSLLKQVTTLTQTVATLTEELKEAKKGSQSQQADPNSQEAIEGLVKSILVPALESLTTQEKGGSRTGATPQEKSRNNKSITPQAKISKPTATATKTPTPTQASYSQKVGGDPAQATPQPGSSSSMGNQTSTSIGNRNNTTADTLEIEVTPNPTPSTSAQEPEFAHTRAQRRKMARQAAKERKKKEKEEEASSEKVKAEREKKKREKRKRLPTSIKHNPATILLLPDSSTPNVLQKLQNLPEADPRQLGVKRHVVFPSGALLVTCQSATQAEQLRGITAKAGIAEKVRKTKAPEFRIHMVPRETTP